MVHFVRFVWTDEKKEWRRQREGGGDILLVLKYYILREPVVHIRLRQGDNVLYFLAPLFGNLKISTVIWRLKS